MAATNSTPNLELSQFIGSDKPDWLTDYNGDMGKIDSSYGAVSAIAEEAAANAESAAASAAQATTDAAAAVSAVAGAVEAAQAAEAAAEQATTTATSALQIANGAATTAQGAAGDATTALSIAQNAKETAESAQAAAAQAAESAAASAAIASGVNSRVTAIEECVPASASSSNKLVTASDITPENDVLVLTVEAESGDTISTVLNRVYAAINGITEQKYINGITKGAAFLVAGSGAMVQQPCRIASAPGGSYQFSSGNYYALISSNPGLLESIFYCHSTTSKYFEVKNGSLTEKSTVAMSAPVKVYIFGINE